MTNQQLSAALKGATAKLLANHIRYGMTIECSDCYARIRYGTAPLFCANCGAKFERHVND